MEVCPRCTELLTFPLSSMTSVGIRIASFHITLNYLNVQGVHKVFEWFENLMQKIVLYDSAVLICIIIEEF